MTTPPPAPPDDYLGRLRQQVRDFAEHEVAPRVAQMEHTQEVDTALARLIARQGWMGPTIAAVHGGMDLGHTAKTIIIEELARVSGAAGAIAQASQLGVAKILHFGTAEQHCDLLPPIAGGDLLPTIAVTEEGSGSHVLGMRSIARRDGSDWILDGAKVYIGNSHVGGLHGVVARIAEGSRGLGAFLVEADRPGVRLDPHRPALGLHGFSFGAIGFAGVRVPADHLLGEVGDGLAVAYSSSILYGRPNLAAVALGLHQGLLETTVAFAGERQRYGKPLAKLPTVKDKIGAIDANVRSARLALYSAVHDLDRGRPCDSALIHAKLTGIELLLDSVRTAMEIHAGAGLDAKAPVARILRDAYHLYAPAGTSDIQRLRLAEDALSHNDPGRRQQWSERFPGRWAHVVGACATVPAALS